MRSTVLSFLLLSLWGGAAVLAAWAVCRLLRRAHAPSRFLCWLWLAVGLRFVLPFGIPLALPRPQNTQLAEAADTVQALTQPELTAPDLPAMVPTSPTAPAPWYTTLTVWHLLAAVWAVGVALLAVRAVWGYLRLSRQVALACKTPDGCFSGPCVPAPFTLGLLRPRVYLPAGLAGHARDAVILHERTHIRRSDPLTKPLFYAVACLHWFNPLAWLAFREFERDMEAACDEAAVRGQSPAARSAYCESILRFAMQGRGVPGSLAFGQGSAKTRIVHLLHYRRLGAGAMVVCAVVIAASMTACMVRPTLENAPAATPETAETAETAEPEATPTPAPTEAPAAAANTAQLPLLEAPDNSPLFIDPVPDYKYISRFKNNSHRGDDLCAAPGTDVLAAADGVVVEAAEHYSWGNFVVIDHGTNGEGYSWRTLYAHLQSSTVQTGQRVVQGQLIGYVGNTGQSTQNHCHFEVYVDGTLTSPRWFTAYHGEGDHAEPTDEERQELIDRCVAAKADNAFSALDTALGGQGAQAIVFSLPLVLSDDVRMSSTFAQNHTGVDLAAPEGTTVLAAADGTVTEYDYNEDDGYYLVLYHGMDDGASWQTRYSHLGSVKVQVGQKVVQGQEIAACGSTGASTGPHLHWEVLKNSERVDPQTVCELLLTM